LGFQTENDRQAFVDCVAQQTTLCEVGHQQYRAWGFQALETEYVRRNQCGSSHRFCVIRWQMATDDNHDNQFSNAVLWPAFHYRLDLVNFQRPAWEGYLRVNACGP
jgi:trehalose-6-phosphate synthase